MSAGSEPGDAVEELQSFLVYEAQEERRVHYWVYTVEALDLESALEVAQRDDMEPIDEFTTEHERRRSGFGATPTQALKAMRSTR